MSTDPSPEKDPLVPRGEDPDEEDFINMKGHPRRELGEMNMGYRLEQVIADLVDNSIDANANNVEVIFDEEDYVGRPSHYIIVADDGGIPGDSISSIMDFEVEHIRRIGTWKIWCV